MSQDELDELEWLRAWDKDLTEEQFNRLKELEIKVDQSQTSKEQGKTVKGIYQPIKIRDGKVKPSEFKTYTFTGDDGEPVEFTGTSEQDAYNQAVASGAITRGKTSRERKEALTIAAQTTKPTPGLEAARFLLSGTSGDMAETASFAGDIAPYSTEARMNYASPKEKLRAFGKDVVTLPVRGLSAGVDALQWLYNDEEPDVGRTSEESQAQGKIVEPILTHPATGAALLTAPFAEALGPSLAGMYARGRGLTGTEALEGAKVAAPWASSAIEGVGSVGAGYALDENYGGDNAVIDIAVSMAAPSLKPVIGKISKTAAISRIKSLFKKSGSELDDEAAQIAYNIIAKEGSYGSPSQVQKNALEKLASQQSPEDYSNIISEKLEFADMLDESNPDLASAKTYLKDLYGKGDKNVVQYAIDDLYNQGAIDIDKYKSYMGRLDEFAKDQKDIYTRYMDGKMPREVYNKRLIDLFMKNEDIPGFSEHFQDIFSSENKMLSQIDPKGFEKARNELLAAKEGMTDDEFYIAQETLLDKWFDGKQMSDVDFGRTVNEANLAGAINKGVLRGGSKFDATRPIESGWPIVKEAARSPTVIRKAGQVAGETARVAPTLRRMYDKPNKNEQSDEDGNLLYAPQGQKSYDWLWEEAEKVKSKAKKLKDLYGD